MAIDFKKALKAAQKNWGKAKKRAAEDTGGFQELLDGRCTARLIGAKLDQSGSGRVQVVMSWKIQDGPNEGKTKYAYNGIETEENLFYLGKDLARFGYELPDDLTDLPDILKDLAKDKPVASIVLKTKGDFQNVFINKVYAADDEESADDEEVDEDAEVEEDEDTAEEEGEESDDADDSEDEDADEEADDEADEDADEESDDEEADEEDADADEESDDEEGEEESDDNEGEEVDLEEGMAVIVETAKGKEKGTIIGIDEEEQKVRVELKSGRKVKVGVDKIDVPEPAPTKANTKKTAPAKKAAPPAKKAAPAKKTAPAKKAAPVKSKTKKR